MRCVVPSGFSRYSALTTEMTTRYASAGSGNDVCISGGVHAEPMPESEPSPRVTTGRQMPISPPLDRPSARPAPAAPAPAPAAPIAAPPSDDERRPVQLAGGRISLPGKRPSGAQRYYATRLWQLAHIDVEEAAAENLWHLVSRHRSDLRRRLGRDVGQRVALLDYIVNVDAAVAEPQIVDRAALQAIEQRAVTDPLTGLYNRRFFEAELVRECERCRRYGLTSSLLLLDVDEFKAINDGYGHRAGDRVLEVLGGLILKHVRAADLPCRYGGDEFAVILPDASTVEAVLVAERIRGDIEDTLAAHPLGGQYGEVTITGGVATMVCDDASSDQLFKEADGALYRAKEAGGDRVLSAADAGVAPPAG